MTTHIIITRDKSGDMFMTIRANDRAVFDSAIRKLKDAVPSDRRSYDPEAREWRINTKARKDFRVWLAFMTTVYGASIEFPYVDDIPPQKSHYPPDAFAVLHLLPSAPPEVIKASYRALSHLFHPDKASGDTAAMQRINDAYRQIAA